MEIIDRLLNARCLRRKIADSRDRLYGVSLAWCGDSAVADDLVQETLMIALQRIHQLRDTERLNAWMYTILSNCWKQHLRRMRPTIDIEDAELCSDSDAEAGSSEQEIVDHVRSAILKLPNGQRQTITLVDLAGFSYAEVAEILDIPIGTVMSRLYTSRHSLQKVLVNFRTSQQPVEATYLRRVK
ncbi:MAG TPA: sigma-70 family RNA polymerase sigma factor [Gammaproteobacteria bacterium]|nr:sigma-70 family RNA polymerase sigma factor [Gammaproteobacteria bacterium]